MSFQLRHLFAALILHGVLFALLAGGARCSRPPPRPPVIEAVLLDPSREQVEARKRKDEQERRRLAEQRRKEEQKRREEEQKQREETERQERERAEVERKRQVAEAEAKRKEQAELKRKEDEARKQRELAEKKKAEEEARRKQQETERREKEERAKREAETRQALEQAMQQEQLQRQIEREQAARAASERDARRNEWALALQRAIRRNWIRPQTTSGDIVCTVRVRLLPDASVTYAKIERSCGNAALDKSVEDAVYRSSPLPRPQDPSVFERELIINFRPTS